MPLPVTADDDKSRPRMLCNKDARVEPSVNFKPEALGRKLGERRTAPIGEVVSEDDVAVSDKAC